MSATTEEIAEVIARGAEDLGVHLGAAQIGLLQEHAALLLRWNQRINLTAVTEPLEVAEKHILDSLACAPLLPAGSLLDAGSGAGYPGIPLRVARADLDVLLVDAVQKKVSFLKAVLARLGLSGLRAQALRLGGDPGR
jgi:16S rRNA (guanine527-N7)-methyltransferase